VPSLPRSLVPIAVALSLLAWGAVSLFSATARAWFERDASARARLAVSGAREALLGGIQRGERARLETLLEDIGRNEHVMGAEVCSPAGGVMARTRGFPAPFACGSLAATAQAADFSGVVDGDQVFVSVLPVLDGDALVGRVALVHDMGFAAQRGATITRVTLTTFAVLGALGGLLAVLLVRATWRSWTAELRRLFIIGRGHGRGRRPGPDTERLANGPLQPVLEDVRRAAADLAAQDARAAGGRWSAERLQRTLELALGGESVVVLSNREPYAHERAAAGGVKVVQPASGLVTALEPVMRACSGTWIAHGSGSADRDVVDAHDRVAVPPGQEAYSLRRVWLSEEERRGYYEGFSNEGLWPLCHIAHARPAFRSDDWRQYQLVNERSPSPSAAAGCSRSSGWARTGSSG
jgi:trehalose 6-phosphate synthase